MFYSGLMDQNGNIKYFSERFLSFFRGFKQIFEREWPNKYLLLPHHTIDKITRKNLRYILKREVFDAKNYRKLDDF